MARFAGVDIPKEKTIEISLTYLYGIGRTTSGKILEKAGIDKTTRTKDLTEPEIAKLRDILDSYQIEGDLRRMDGLNIKRLAEINCYRGIRHRKGLPARGQRTKTNARTRRGKKKGPASGKKKA